MIHLYHGDGKGKTTAAVGLAVRAAGAGYKVYFCQFMKGGESSELNILSGLQNVTIIRCKKEYPFYNRMSPEQKAELTDEHNNILHNLLDVLAKRNKTMQTMSPEKNSADKLMVVLDELTYPLMWSLIDENLVNDILSASDENTEIICTGRNPEEFLINKSDYITEMKCEKHPYTDGVLARKGIEF